MAGFWIAVAVGASFVGVRLAAPPPPAEMAPPVATCITENAPKVEQAVASLTDATTFLVDDVCADTIADELTRQSHAQLQKMRDKQHQDCLAEQSQPKKRQDDAEACAIDKMYSSLDGEGGGWTLFTGMSAINRVDGERQMPEATAFAAKLLLELRLAHAKH